MEEEVLGIREGGIEKVVLGIRGKEELNPILHQELNMVVG